MEILLSLFVIAPIIFLGWLARRLDLISKEHCTGLSFYVYYFALPALFFSKIIKINIFNLDHILISISVIPIIITIAILFLLKNINLISKNTFVTLGISIVFGSNAFFGIAFFEALRGSEGLNFAIITASVLGPLGILGSLFFLEYANNKGQYFILLKKIFTNPLIISIVLGILISFIKTIPKGLLAPLELIGKTAGPIAIFALGTFIYDNFSYNYLAKAFKMTLFRITVLPLSTIFTMIYISPNNNQLKEMLILQSGVPAAISLSILAKRYDYKIGEISNFVILSSLLSFFLLGILYYVVT